MTESVESEGYVTMTERALETAKIHFQKDGMTYEIPGNQRFLPPAELRVESDWSSAAVFFCIGAQSEKGVSIGGMNLESCHADRKILEILKGFGVEVTEKDGAVTVKRGKLLGQEIDASNCPDLVPSLAALSCAAEGETRIIHAGRLRLKESDRLKSTAAMLRALGADIEEEKEGLLIRGTGSLNGGTVETSKDHRIAMAASVAACCCKNAVRIKDAECVEKSYPSFFMDLNALKMEN